MSKSLRFSFNGSTFNKIFKPDRDEFKVVVGIIERKANLSLPNDWYLMIGDEIVVDGESLKSALLKEKEFKVLITVIVMSILC